MYEAQSANKAEILPSVTDMFQRLLYPIQTAKAQIYFKNKTKLAKSPVLLIKRGITAVSWNKGSMGQFLNPLGCASGFSLESVSTASLHCIWVSSTTVLWDSGTISKLEVGGHGRESAVP